jgi:hypothetical protein
MEVRELIDRAAFRSDTRFLIKVAFDKASARIESTYGSDPKDIAKGRLRLAHALLEVATDNTRDAEKLSKAALEAMALGYKRRFLDPEV